MIMNRSTVRRSRLRNVLSSNRVDSLEARCLLTKFPAQISIHELPNPGQPGTDELIILGTKQNDQISINDNGTGTAGNIFVSFNGGGTYMSTGAVSAVSVLTGAGNDRVTYELDGNLVASGEEIIEVGSGAKTGHGTVQATVNIVGAIEDGSSLLAVAVPDAKKLTTMAINDSGEIDGDLSAGISTFEDPKLKPGPENFSFQSTATVGPDGRIDTGMIGGKHNDIGKLTYSGYNYGEIDVTETGKGNKDQLSADVFMGMGSTGTVGASGSGTSIIAGKGRSHLRFTVERGTDTTSTTGVFAQVVGASRKVVVDHTANVTVQSKGTVILVS
jgi:hypothetical protein